MAEEKPTPLNEKLDPHNTTLADWGGICGPVEATESQHPNSEHSQRSHGVITPNGQGAPGKYDECLVQHQHQGQVFPELQPIDVAPILQPRAQIGGTSATSIEASRDEPGHRTTQPVPPRFLLASASRRPAVSPFEVHLLQEDMDAMLSSSSWPGPTPNTGAPMDPEWEASVLERRAASERLQRTDTGIPSLELLGALTDVFSQPAFPHPSTRAAPLGGGQLEATLNVRAQLIPCNAAQAKEDISMNVSTDTGLEQEQGAVLRTQRRGLRRARRLSDLSTGAESEDGSREALDVGRHALQENEAERTPRAPVGESRTSGKSDSSVESPKQIKRARFNTEPPEDHATEGNRIMSSENPNSSAQGVGSRQSDMDWSLNFGQMQAGTATDMTHDMPAAAQNERRREYQMQAANSAAMQNPPVDPVADFFSGDENKMESLAAPLRSAAPIPLGMFVHPHHDSIAPLQPLTQSQSSLPSPPQQTLSSAGAHARHTQQQPLTHGGVAPPQRLQQEFSLFKGGMLLHDTPISPPQRLNSQVNLVTAGQVFQGGAQVSPATGHSSSPPRSPGSWTTSPYRILVPSIAPEQDFPGYIAERPPSNLTRPPVPAASVTHAHQTQDPRAAVQLQSGNPASQLPGNFFIAAAATQDDPEEPEHASLSSTRKSPQKKPHSR